MEQVSEGLGSTEMKYVNKRNLLTFHVYYKKNKILKIEKN